MTGRIWIGTSGFNYKHWAHGVFYPDNLGQKEWFSFYVTKFNTVELNVTFYRLLKKEIYEHWFDTSPDAFRFAIKGSRYITHQKRLLEIEDALFSFSSAASGLKEKLAVVLWQFPPSFKNNIERLNSFIGSLKKDQYLGRTAHAFELRHESWFVDEIYDLLRANNIAFCIADSTRWPEKEILTADFSYVRFHGSGKVYTSEYSTRELNEWAEKIKSWPLKEVFVYFNNDAFGFAPKNAHYLSGQLFS